VEFSSVIHVNAAVRRVHPTLIKCQFWLPADHNSHLINPHPVCNCKQLLPVVAPASQRSTSAGTVARYSPIRVKRVQLNDLSM